MNKFIIIPGDSFIWNKDELLQFLIDNQHKDILIVTSEEGCCLTSIGLYKLLDSFQFASVTIHTANPIEYHNVYNIIVEKSDKFFKIPSGTDYTQYHQWNRNTVFGALYNRASWHRLGLASHLYNKNTTLNFRYNPHNNDIRKEVELQQLFNIDPQSVWQFMSLYEKFPVLIDQQDTYTLGATTKQHTDQFVEFYKDFLIDIVAETFTSGRTFFPTEKTIRPMLMKKPFIIMGPKCFLIHLRQMGFKTFYEFWDEDYDGYSPAEKYKHILTLISALSKKTSSELTYMYNNMQSILDHNYNLLINQNYSTIIDYVD